MVGRCALVFYRVLREAKIRFVVDRHPTACPHCAEGPANLKAYDDIVATLAATRDSIGKSELKKLNETFTGLRTKVATYRRHLKQWTVRNYLNYPSHPRDCACMQ